jgi:3-oxoacyl-[acyl-carrier-protein] synthase-3
VTIKIIGTGIGLPSREFSNDELIELTGLDSSNEWIVSKSGIDSRYLCVTETLTDLATAAAEQALADAGLGAKEIDYILIGTLGGEYCSPSLACAVAERIGATSPAVDLNAGCVGFIYCLDTAAALISAGRAKNVLIIGAEKMSAHSDWTDRGTCVLFGDGAAACVVTAGTMLKYIQIRSAPDTQVLNIPEDMSGNWPLAGPKPADTFVHMDGPAVFKRAVTMVGREVQDALTATGLAPEEIDFYLLHQANRRIIDSAIKRLEQSPDRFPMNIQRHGNVSGASIPLLLHQLRVEGKVEPGQTHLLCAFGSGMTVGTCLWVWE